MSTLSKIIIVICLIVFCGCGAYLGNCFLGNTSASNQLKEIREEVPEGESVLIGLHEKNSDIFGWVTIDDTKIDYPVMSVSVDDDEYYLHRDFQEEYSASGTPFKDALSDDKSFNWLIYGHNMKMGTMFHDLLKFDSQDFWQDHEYFSFSHLEKDPESGELVQIDQQCQVVAAGYSQIYAAGDNKFKYYEYADISDRDRFAAYKAGILAQSCIDTDVDIKYGDQLVTLSTCAYHTEDGRFYVVGKLLENIK